jgi:hypothetical protein
MAVGYALRGDQAGIAQDDEMVHDCYRGGARAHHARHVQHFERPFRVQECEDQHPLIMTHDAEITGEIAESP